MNAQLELALAKTWCTAGCGQLLTNEEFKSHVCVVRDRAEKKSRGVVFVKRTPEQIRQAEDAAIERERVRTLNEESSRSLLAAGTVGEKVAEVLEGPAPSSPSPLPRELKEETYQEDADFDLYQRLDPRLVQMFRDRIRGIRVECPAHKASKWKHFVTDGGFIVPDKFSFLPPATRPENEKYNLAGWVEINIEGMSEEDLKILDTIKTKAGVPYSKKMIKRKRDTIGHFRDVKLALTLLCTNRSFKITSEPWLSRRRGPRKQK